MFNSILNFAITAPKGSGIITKLMPLANKLTEFALVAGIIVGLWGMVQFIMGDPSGKQRTWQAILGFIGVFVIPMIFFAIWDAFHNM